MKLDKRLVYLATTLVVLVACALVSILFMPVYYAMLSDALPQSMVPIKLRGQWVPNQTGMRTFCSSCYFLPLSNSDDVTMKCPAPNTNQCTCPAAASIVEKARTEQPPTRSEFLPASDSIEHKLPPPVTVKDDVTVLNDDTKSSEYVENSRVVPGSLADTVRVETVKSGHGVASDPHYQVRHPQAVSDADSLNPEDYLIDR
jgi:hypothetical protein